MSTSFSIDFSWLPYEDSNNAEHSTFAEITININSSYATEVEDLLAKSVRPSARLSALYLAEWFAYNWWRLLWEPEIGNSAQSYSWRASHKIGNAGNGYIWPDLSFSSDWQSIQIRSQPTRRWHVEPIRYLNYFEHSLSIKDFEKGVDDFINATLARLSAHGKSYTELNLLWNEVLSERRDPEMSERRKLEARMGFDPDEAPSQLLNSLEEMMKSYGKGAIHEMAADSKVQTIHHIDELFDDAIPSALNVNLPKWDEIRKHLDANVYESHIPWKRAEHAAQVARDAWGVQAPVSTDKLCDILSMPKDIFLDGDAYQNPLIAGLRSDSSPSEFCISLNSKRETSRRFAVARLVADGIVADEDERLLPGTRARTDRQKFQRAFAQAFLCPFDALNEYLNAQIPTSVDEIDEAAQHFNVSPLLIRTTLVNKGVLERESLIEGIY